MMKALPNTSVKVSLRLYAAGYCSHPEWVTIRGGSLRACRFPAGFALIEHPVRGPVLFDTGYASRFFAGTARLPMAVYRWLTPVVYREEESAANQLRRDGIEPERVRYVIVSHFHADHIGGLRDFPNARFVYMPEAYEEVRHCHGFAALRKGFVPELVPDDFGARALPMDRAHTVPFPSECPFPQGIDVFGDGSLYAADVPGHAAGQIGLFLSTERHDYFLCADTVWSSRAFRECRPPHPLAGLIMSGRHRYRESFERLHELHKRCPQLRIVPSHCREALERWGTEGALL
jgi:glyoxylase-like metal-dependent hydrolase (beta-lactamase superfamily II)